MVIGTTVTIKNCHNEPSDVTVGIESKTKQRQTLVDLWLGCLDKYHQQLHLGLYPVLLGL